MLELCDDRGFALASVVAYHIRQRDPGFFTRTYVRQFKKLVQYASWAGAPVRWFGHQDQTVPRVRLGFHVRYASLVRVLFELRDAGEPALASRVAVRIRQTDTGLFRDAGGGRFKKLVFQAAENGAPVAWVEQGVRSSVALTL